MKIGKYITQRIQKIEPENAKSLAKSHFMSSSKFKFPYHLNQSYSHATPLPFSAPSSIRNLDHFPHKDYWFLEEQLFPLRPMGVDLPHNLCFPLVSFGSPSQSLQSCNEFPIEDHKFAPDLMGIIGWY